MNRTAKIARQSVLIALVAITAAWLGATVAVNQVSHKQFAAKPSNSIFLVDDGPLPCAKC
jgi:hypothetical protein